MAQSNEKLRSFIPLPAALLPVLTDRALRILLYAIDRQGLVRLGKLKVWKLYPKVICKEFKNHRGYTRNSLAVGIRVLLELNLIEFKGDHYVLNVEELNRWFGRRRQSPIVLPDIENEGLPVPDEGGLPNFVEAGVPKSGDQEKKRSKEKSIKREDIKEELTRKLEPTVAGLEESGPEELREQIYPAIDFDEQDQGMSKMVRRMAHGNQIPKDVETSKDFLDYIQNM